MSEPQRPSDPNKTSAPTLLPVQSSNIAAVGHQGSTLYVRFHSGALWRYEAVPQRIYDEMMQSGSIGKYFAKFIRPNHPGSRMPENSQRS